MGVACGLLPLTVGLYGECYVKWVWQGCGRGCGEWGSS